MAELPTVLYIPSVTVHTTKDNIELVVITHPHLSDCLLLDCHMPCSVNAFMISLMRDIVCLDSLRKCFYAQSHHSYNKVMSY